MDREGRRHKERRGPLKGGCYAMPCHAMSCHARLILIGAADRKVKLVGHAGVPKQAMRCDAMRCDALRCAALERASEARVPHQHQHPMNANTAEMMFIDVPVIPTSRRRSGAQDLFFFSYQSVTTLSG